MKAAQIGKMLSTLWTDEDGVTAIEYALLASLIATVIVGSVIVIGTAVLALYELVVAAFP
ncbi:Flp family type IVb pilin [Aromatoleum toluclasticum]|uniref:Flp family type IVb pilin n=1 Tax=Aromatoleum toluclasticum TaxID=92003 RepID=UPI000380F7EC|nr:Flp family type IVb pilin [Aromatoleum toluclasticum]